MWNRPGGSIRIFGGAGGTQGVVIDMFVGIPVNSTVRVGVCYTDVSRDGLVRRERSRRGC